MIQSRRSSSQWYNVICLPRAAMSILYPNVNPFHFAVFCCSHANLMRGAASKLWLCRCGNRCGLALMTSCRCLGKRPKTPEVGASLLAKCPQTDTPSTRLAYRCTRHRCLYASRRTGCYGSERASYGGDVRNSYALHTCSIDDAL